MGTKEEYEAIFKEFDADGSGFVTKDELTSALSKKGFTSAQIEGTLQATDASGDGKVSLQEFLAAMGAVPPIEVKKASLRCLFRSFDTDGTGKIDKKELKKVFDEMKRGLSEEDCARIIEMGDADGDGQLDYEEFIEEVFGASA